MKAPPPILAEIHLPLVRTTPTALRKYFTFLLMEAKLLVPLAANKKECPLAIVLFALAWYITLNY